MTNKLQRRREKASLNRVVDFILASDVIEDFLDELVGEAEDHIEIEGGFRGRVRERQRSWSQALDEIEVQRQDSGLT